MATNEELSKAFKILCGAGLEYTPSEKELPMRTEAWGELLADVPGDLLIQGVKDIALAGERFPSIKRIRDAAYQVQIHNGTSAAPNPWKPIIAGKQDRGTGVYVVTPEGFKPWVPTGQPVNSIYPAHVLEEIERITAKYDMGAADLEMACMLPTDEEMEYLDRLTEPYLRAALPEKKHEKETVYV